MGERASGWLLLVLILAQLALLASQVPDLQGDGASTLEAWALRVTAVPARWVVGTEGSLTRLGGGMRSRSSLLEENRALRGEMEALRQEVIRLQAIEKEADRLAAALDYAPPRLGTLRPADIVYADHTSWLRSIVLRVGEGGVPLHAPVLAASGLVGRVVVAAGPYAKVQLLTDRASSVGAMVERSRRQGVLRGRGQALLSMDYVPLSADIRPGDRVVTAGIDGIFPRGLLVGVVVATEPRPSELFLEVDVAPAVDLGQLDQVYLLDREVVPEAIKEAQPGEIP